MAQNTNLTPTTSAASTTVDIVATSGGCTIGLYVTAGTVPPDARASVYVDTPSTVDNYVGDLTGGATRAFAGPATYRVIKQATSVAVGVYSET